MIRKDLIRALQEKGFSIAEARRILDSIFGSIRNALLRYEEVATPIGLFRRDKEGSTCITDSLVEGGKRSRRLVYRRPAIDYFPDYPHRIDFVELEEARARGEGQIWQVRRHSGRSTDGSRIVYRGSEQKARQRYRGISVKLRQGSVELLNRDGSVAERTTGRRGRPPRAPSANRRF